MASMLLLRIWPRSSSLTSAMPCSIDSTLSSARCQFVVDALVEVVVGFGGVLAELLDVVLLTLGDQTHDIAGDVRQADADAVEGVAVPEIGGERMDEPDGSGRNAEQDERHAHRAHHVQVHRSRPRCFQRSRPPIGHLSFPRRR